MVLDAAAFRIKNLEADINEQDWIYILFKQISKIHYTSNYYNIGVANPIMYRPICVFLRFYFLLLALDEAATRIFTMFSCI